jgi:hypothetical protein
VQQPRSLACNQVKFGVQRGRMGHKRSHGVKSDESERESSSKAGGRREKSLFGGKNSPSLIATDGAVNRFKGLLHAGCSLVLAQSVLTFSQHAIPTATAQPADRRVAPGSSTAGSGGRAWSSATVNSSPMRLAPCFSLCHCHSISPIFSFAFFGAAPPFCRLASSVNGVQSSCVHF